MKKILFILLITWAFQDITAQVFSVSYSPAVYKENFSGRVFLYMSKDNRSPKDAMVGLEPVSFFSVEVKDIVPGQPVTIDDKAISFPVALSNTERGNYFVQVVWDRDLGGRSIAESEGNLYSATQRVTLSKNFNENFSVVADKILPAPSFTETKFVKELKAPSTLLSGFHKKKITVDAAVILPKEYYTDNTKKFPVLFTVAGFGGDYHRLSGDTMPSNPIDTVPVIWVYLDGNCPLGHSVYANSDNNGPVGDALTKEFIPLLEEKYRCNGARLLQGHSSGGWTVLWLQTQYPQVFAGCASSSPDPVDFRNFQKVNLYEGGNLYYGKDSSLNLVATVAGRYPWGYMKTVYQAENVIYRGEQMHSFDAVFSAKNNDGNPERICNAATGEIDKKTFDHWKKYDISLYIRTNWDKIKNELDGKIRVSVGNHDNFLLNHSVKLLEQEMKKLNSHFEFAYYPGDHFTVSTKEYRQDQANFLEKKYAEWLKKQGAAK